MFCVQADVRCKECTSWLGSADPGSRVAGDDDEKFTLCIPELNHQLLTNTFSDSSSILSICT